MNLTMGSLFDGIGGFPLAAERYGIKTLWASEIEPFPMKVTERRFPGMAHKGDITKLNGRLLLPVDIICGGSPCQDLSVAGARAGLSGARSGLFMEQIRIIKEMRTAERERGRTGADIRPRWMCWENVPGAFSSGSPKGEDFRIVLEEIIRIHDIGAEVPRSYPYSWPDAGDAVMENGFSLAWRCLDAQFWGVAQRRKRIFLVADFAGPLAPLLLFDVLDGRLDYARYLSCGEQPEPEAMIVHLDPAEQRTIIQALVEQRERQEQAMSQTEQLLRRMTGSITAYMEEVGQRPLRMSDYDKTVLAIQDGELTEFWARYPKALDQADSLLVETAGRPGAVGRRMTLSILSAATKISPSAYLTACKRAVDTGDGQRVQSLIEQAESCLSEPLPALTGVAILHAYTNGHRNMAKDLIAQCTSEQIAAAPPNLLRLVAERLDFQTAMELVDKGVQPGDYAADVLHTLTGQHQEWMAEKLLEHGMPVAADNYAALYVCVNNQAAGVAKLLLDRGMDLEQYQTWAEKQRKNEGYEETMAELTEYWSELQSGPEQDSPSMDGMSL